MEQYVIMIAGGAVLSAFADIMVPSGWKKYMRIITGFILLAVIMSPAARLSGMSIFKSSFPVEEVEYTPMPQIVAKELEERISADVQARIQSEFGAQSSAEARVRVNADGQIECVEEIVVYTKASADAVKRRLCEVYGAENVRVRSG